MRKQGMVFRHLVLALACVFGGSLSTAVSAAAQVAATEEVREGACPFECCQYGRWVAESPVPVHPAELDTAHVAFRLVPADTFTAVTGNVHVRPVGLVRVTERVTPSPYDRPELELAPGDSLLVLEPSGEGYYRVRYQGEEMTVQGFWAAPGDERSWYGTQEIAGTLVREPVYAWWVRIEDEGGRSGWIRMSRDVRVWGHDACG